MRAKGRVISLEELDKEHVNPLTNGTATRPCPKTFTQRQQTEKHKNKHSPEVGTQPRLDVVITPRSL